MTVAACSTYSFELLFLFSFYHLAKIGGQESYRFPAKALDGVGQQDIHFCDTGNGEKDQGEKWQKFG